MRFSATFWLLALAAVVLYGIFKAPDGSFTSGITDSGFGGGAGESGGFGGGGGGGF